MATGRITFEVPDQPPQWFDVRLPDATAGEPVEPPPEPPSGVTARMTDADSAELRWSDNSPDEAGFEVQQSANGGEFEPLADLPGNAAVLVLDRLLPGTRYGFRVRAVGDRGGPSAWSPAADLDVPRPPEPEDEDPALPEPATPPLPGSAKAIGDLRDAKSEGGAYVLERPCRGGVVLPPGVSVWVADETVVVDGAGVAEVLRLGAGVTLVGLRVRGGGVKSQDNHRAAVLMASGCSCYGCEVWDTLGVGWAFNKARDVRVIGLYAHDNGVAGFGGSNGTNVYEWRVRTERNNSSHSSNGGDGKRTRCTNYVMVDHRAVGNYGEGPWFDYNNVNVLIRRLHSEANENYYAEPSDTIPKVAGRGSFLEVSGVVQDKPGSPRARGEGWIKLLDSHLIRAEKGRNPQGFPAMGVCISASRNVLVKRCVLEGNIIGIMGDREPPFRSERLRFEDLTFRDIGRWDPIARHPRNRPGEPQYTTSNIRVE